MLIRIGDQNVKIVEVFPHCVLVESHIVDFEIYRSYGGFYQYKVFNKEGKEEQVPFSQITSITPYETCEGMVIFNVDFLQRAILLTSTGKFLSNKDGEKIFEGHKIQGDKIKIRWNKEVTEWYDFSGNLIAGIAGIEGSREPQKLYDKDNEVIAVIEYYPLEYVKEVKDSENNIVGLSFILSGERAFYWF